MLIHQILSKTLHFYLFTRKTAPVLSTFPFLCRTFCSAGTLYENYFNLTQKKKCKCQKQQIFENFNWL